MAWVLGHGAGQRESGVVGPLAGAASVAGVVSNARQRSRSLVSAALQLGEQIEGCGVWRALSGSGASLGGGTVPGEVVGKVALQPVASSNSTQAASPSPDQASSVRREKMGSEGMAKTQDREPVHTSKGAEFNQSRHTPSG